MATTRVGWVCLTGILALGLVACKQEGRTSPASTAAGGTSVNATPATATAALPTISGSPATVVVAGAAYSFTPAAVGASGTTLTFSVQNLPAWATFNAGTGQLSGTPAVANVGTYANILISVSDGTHSASLTAFAIHVQGTATGSATLSWTPPTQNTDGSALTDLAGYHVYYGTNPNALTQSVDIPASNATSYVVNNLYVGGTYYFAVTAYDSNHVESNFSGVTSKTI
jgi:hypothetical protein